MDTSVVDTLFLPALLAPEDTVQRQERAFAESPLLREVVDVVPGIVVVLNCERQVVFANEALLRFVTAGREDAVYGRRVGEIVNCVHAFESLGGCGTSEACRTCGAAQAIQAAQQQHITVQECRIIQRTEGDALDLQVSVRPLRWQGEDYVVAAIVDISQEQRRRALERIFFHDILNTAGVLRGFTSVLQETPPAEAAGLIKEVYRLADRLIDEISAQRELVAAENSELKVHPEPVHSLALLEETAEAYRQHELAQQRFVRVDPGAQATELVIDRVLIGRVLGNMLKNALEASRAGETVTLGCSERDGSVEFWVHNPHYLPRNVQLQVFQRSFSTKGAGRGLGTYSMRLLSERYLNGRVSFSTSPEAGTTFRAVYARVLPDSGQSLV